MYKQKHQIIGKRLFNINLFFGGQGGYCHHSSAGLHLCFLVEEIKITYEEFAEMKQKGKEICGRKFLCTKLIQRLLKIWRRKNNLGLSLGPSYNPILPCFVVIMSGHNIQHNERIFITKLRFLLALLPKEKGHCAFKTASFQNTP